MALLKSKRDTPPGGWKFLQKETDFTVTGENEEQLIGLVVAHRQYRNLQPQDRESVRLDIERQICTRLGNLECKAEGKDDAWVPQNPVRHVITMSMMLGFSKAALAFVASGGKLATIEEAQRRANICKDCPLNQPMVGCSCGTFLKTIEASVPKERRFMPDRFCAACSCSLSAKVNLTEDQVVYSNEGRKDIKWPEGVGCWQAGIMKAAASGGT